MKKRTERISREAFSSLGRPVGTRHSPFVTVRRFTQQKISSRPSIVITISKKEIATAVKRNLLRRKYAEIFREIAIKIEGGDVFQCIVKKKALDASFQDLSLDLAAVLQSFYT